MQAKGSNALEHYRESIEANARLEGIEQGIERGIEQGIAMGTLMAKREGLHAVLNARFGCASDERVTTCTNASTLDAWLLLAVRVATLEDVFR